MAREDLARGRPARCAIDPLPGDGITFIGTATTLVRVGGFTVVTDPNFLHRGERARLGMGLRSERLTEPAMSIDELPPLDAVVLSHHHGDHFDDVATRELDRDVPIVSTHHAVRKLRREGFRALVGLEPWQQHVLDGRDATLRITAVPGQHAPRPVGWLIPPVIGTLWDLEREGERVLRMYVTGDTLVHDGLREIAERFPDIDVCLLHLGGTRIAGLLLTMDDAQGVQALEIVRPRAAIPIHHDDYSVFRSPLAAFLERAGRAGWSDRIHVLARGERFPLDRASEGRRSA